MQDEQPSTEHQWLEPEFLATLLHTRTARQRHEQRTRRWATMAVVTVTLLVLTTAAAIPPWTEAGQALWGILVPFSLGMGTLWWFVKRRSRRRHDDR